VITDEFQFRAAAPTARDIAIDLLHRLRMTSIFASPGSAEAPA
jgi:hypothetical protein